MTPDDSEAWVQTASVRVRGIEYRGEKKYWTGTQRSVSPQETLDTIRPVLRKAGITRLANITGLDRIGIPTTLSMRPNGLTLSNSSGKGLTLEAAMASGAMEAIELFHVEECQLRSERLSHRQVTVQYPCLTVDELPLARSAPFSRDWPYLWTFGWDLVSQCDVALPVCIVHMGNRQQRIDDLFSFQVTSNGLASGNNMLEAINAGLFEAIERDAVTCHRERWHTTGEGPPVVKLESVEHPLARGLLDGLADVGIAPIMFDCTVDTAVPVYMVFLVDLLWPNVGVFKGYGAHLDPEIAMTRALTEAAQGRVVNIAGSRDDLFRHKERRLRSDLNDRSAMGLLDFLEPTVDARDRTSDATPTFEGDTLLAVERLRAAGLSKVLVVDLSRDDFPVNVVKVVVPGLEGYTFENYQPGPRALAFAGQPVRL
jgi:ribosomal protein S12 methylthiotransferase accessory factor